MTERGALLGGRYLLDQVIGRGGMAEVWRARDTRLERDVAVKRLRVDLASDATFQARFRREAQSAAGLNHPNVVAVYDTGEERDGVSGVSVPYIVMELVEGVTLREVLRDGRKILPQRALEFTAGVLDALAYSHRAGIIHRDIKPANVMLTPNGTVKVMDFGIARAVADTSATMTQTAAVIGTAQYLSPEQARGEKVDNRSDIYSVGCLLYELLTSEPLFKGDSPVSVAYQHVREAPVPPSQLDSEVTADMDAVVLKSLEKDPRDRYQDASEFREDVLRAMRGEPVHVIAPAATAMTTVIPSDPMTTTARRGAPTAVTPATNLLPNEEPEEEEEQPKSRKGLVALLVVAALVLVGLGIGVFALMNGPRPTPTATIAMVDVPNVLGQNQAAAEQMLKDAGLVVEVNPVSGTADNKGQVVAQDPGSGEQIPEGSTVTIDVSQGPESKTIPESIIGVPYETAKELLTAAGFTNVAPAEEEDPANEDPEASEGDVTSSNPKVGTSVSLDQEITLKVATGKSLVPTLTGMTLEQATAKAGEKGFQVTSEEVETSSAAVGQVVEQSVAAGTAESRRDTTIVLKVAKAPVVTVPNVVGMNEERAREQAETNNFTIEFEYVQMTSLPEGVSDRMVYEQTPTAGTTATGDVIQAKIAVLMPNPSDSGTP